MKDDPEQVRVPRDQIDDHLRRAFIELESTVPERLIQLLADLKAGEHPQLAELDELAELAGAEASDADG